MPEFQKVSPRTHQARRARLVWGNHACVPLRADTSCLTHLERYRGAGVNVVWLNIGFGDTWAEQFKRLKRARYDKLRDYA